MATERPATNNDATHLPQGYGINSELAEGALVQATADGLAQDVQAQDENQLTIRHFLKIDLGRDTVATAGEKLGIKTTTLEGIERAKAMLIMERIATAVANLVAFTNETKINGFNELKQIIATELKGKSITYNPCMDEFRTFAWRDQNMIN